MLYVILALPALPPLPSVLPLPIEPPLARPCQGAIADHTNKHTRTHRHLIGIGAARANGRRRVVVAPQLARTARAERTTNAARTAVNTRTIHRRSSQHRLIIWIVAARVITAVSRRLWHVGHADADADGRGDALRARAHRRAHRRRVRAACATTSQVRSRTLRVRAHLRSDTHCWQLTPVVCTQLLCKQRYGTQSRARDTRTHVAL
jgi:hypothetical protein